MNVYFSVSRLVWYNLCTEKYVYVLCTILSETNMSNNSQTHLFIVIIPVHIQQLILQAALSTFTVLTVNYMLHLVWMPVLPIHFCRRQSLFCSYVVMIFLLNILVVAMARLQSLIMCEYR